MVPAVNRVKNWELLILSLLTPWCRVLLEQLTGLQLVKKFPTFHGTRRFITALTSVRHLSLSWALQNKHPACECFVTEVSFREGLLAPRATSKLEDHPSSAVRDCSFDLFAATLLIWDRSSVRNLRTRHAVVTGTLYIIIIIINCNWVVTRWQWLFYICTKYGIGY